MVANKVTQRIDKNPSDRVCAIDETAGFKPDIYLLFLMSDVLHSDGLPGIYAGMA